jgi:uncharacterized membrane protein YhaH (DUF805 family)
MSSYPPPPAYSAPSPGPAGEPPLGQPFYSAPFGVAVRRFFRKYATFSGRASRSEFWWWYLTAIIIGFVLNILTSVLGGSHVSASGQLTYSAGAIVVLIIGGLWSLAILVPSLAISWRRLHDTGRSGGWYFIGLIPLVGTILLIVWFASAPKPEGQRFDR